MTNEEILAQRKADDELRATPLGKAFFNFVNLHGRAWQMDTEDSFTDKDRKSTKETWEKEKIAYAEVKKLMREALGL